MHERIQWIVSSRVAPQEYDEIKALVPAMMSDCRDRGFF